MTIDKAIEILTSNKKELLISSIADLRTAQQMGIEALKRIKQNRTLHFRPSQILLPGETED